MWRESLCNSMGHAEVNASKKQSFNRAQARAQPQVQAEGEIESW